MRNTANKAESEVGGKDGIHSGMAKCQTIAGSGTDSNLKICNAPVGIKG